MGFSHKKLIFADRHTGTMTPSSKLGLNADEQGEAFLACIDEIVEHVQTLRGIIEENQDKDDLRKVLLTLEASK